MQTASYYPNSNFLRLLSRHSPVRCSSFLLLKQNLAISSYLLILPTIAHTKMSSWFMVAVLLITTLDISH